MHCVKIIFLAFIGLISAVVFIVVFTFSSYNNQDYQQLLIKAVDNLTDYQLSITGEFAFEPAFLPVLSASVIKLQSKTDNSHISIDRFRVQISLNHVLKNTLLIKDLLVEGLYAEIQGNESPQDTHKLFSAMPIPIIEHALIKNVRLINLKKKQTYILDKLLVNENDEQDQLEILALGKSGQHNFNAAGFITLTNEANEVNNISHNAIVEFLSDNHTQAKFKGHAMLGNSTISFEFLLSIKHGKLEITGELNSVKLLLSDFDFIMAQDIAKSSPNRKSSKPGKESLFSHKPLSLQILHAVDLNLHIKLQQIRYKSYTLRNLTTNLMLNKGKLIARPISFNFAGEKVIIMAEVSANGKPEWALQVRVNDIQIRELLGQSKSSTAATGKLGINVNLKGKGASEHAIASSLNGNVSIVLENETITREELEIVFLNPLGWVFSQGISENKIQISCGLVNYKIRQGIAKSKVLLVDGPKILIKGNQEINLGSETINSFYNLKKKNIFENSMIPSFFDTSVPVKVSGNLVDPLVEQAPLDSIESKAGRYIFAPATTIPRELLGTVFDMIETEKKLESPCAEFLEK